MGVTHRLFRNNDAGNVSSIPTGTALDYSTVTDTGKIVLFILAIRDNDATGEPTIGTPTLNGVNMELVLLKSLTTFKQYVYKLHTTDIPSTGSHAVAVSLTSGERVRYACSTLVAGNTSEIEVLDSTSKNVFSTTIDQDLDATGKTDADLLVYDFVSLPIETTYTINPDDSQTSVPINSVLASRLGVKPVTESGSFSQGYSWSGNKSAIGLAVLLDSAPSGVGINFSDTNSALSWSGTCDLSGLTKTFADTLGASWSGQATLKGVARSFADTLNLRWSGTSTLRAEKQFSKLESLAWSGSALLKFDFNFKFCFDSNTESRTDYQNPQVFLELDNTTPIGSTFVTGEEYEGRVLEIPSIVEQEFDAQVGIAGFDRFSVTLDNADLSLSPLEFQDIYAKATFVEGGSVYKTISGKVTAVGLGTKLRLDIESIELTAMKELLPKRLITTDEFPDADEDILETPVPIVIGQNKFLQTTLIRHDDNAEQYDYLLGEGIGIDGNWSAITNVYRKRQRLDDFSFTTTSIAPAGRINLPNNLQRPDEWFTGFWVFALGNALPVTAYDSDLNRITFGGGTVIQIGTPVELREWRFFDGSQLAANNHPGYAFLRFKKFLHSNGNPDPISVDCDALQGEKNPVKFIRSLITNSTWGLGLTVDTDSFTSAEALSKITALKLEGNLTQQAEALDWLRDAMKFRDMVLNKTSGDIAISVDDEAKIPVMTLTHGEHEASLENIVTQDPVLETVNVAQKTKNLKVQFRKNNRESQDSYFLSLEREASSNGVDATEQWPLVYDIRTMDRILDFRRKKLDAYSKRLSLSVENAARTVLRNEIVTLNISTLALSNANFEIVSARKQGGNVQSFDLVPNNALAYVYEQIAVDPPEEGSIDIPSFEDTNPEPVTAVQVTAGVDVMGITGTPFMIVSWNHLDDGNYGGAEVSMKLSSEPLSAWKSKGIVEGDNIRIDGLVPGQSYIFLIESLNITKEFKGLGVLSSNQVAGGTVGPPNRPATPTATERLGKVIFKWARNTESDISHYVPTVYNAQTNGNRVAVLPVVQHDHNDPFFSPEIEYQANAGSLTSTNNPAWLEVVAVNYTLQESPSSFRGGVSTTTPVDTPDIGDGAVTDSKVANLSADKITTGTLTINNSTGASINATGSGAATFSNGGDIVMKSSVAGDNNLIKFQNSGSTTKGILGYNTTTDRFFIKASDTASLDIISNNRVVLGFQGMEPVQNGSVDLGTDTRRWRHIYTDDITSTNALVVGDISLGGGKGFIITEPDKVYKNKKVDDGVVFMSNDWKVVMYYENATKTLKVAGNIESDCDFPEPDIPRKSNSEEEN